MTAKTLIVVFLVCIYKCTEGTAKFKSCVVYFPNEAKAPLSYGMARYCEKNWLQMNETKDDNSVAIPKDSDFCLEYKCPTLKCDEGDIVKEEGKCDKCRGDCEWHGKIVKNGETAKCKSGCNFCQCLDGESFALTMVGCNVAFC